MLAGIQLFSVFLALKEYTLRSKKAPSRYLIENCNCYQYFKSISEQEWENRLF